MKTTISLDEMKAAWREATGDRSLCLQRESDGGFVLVFCDTGETFAEFPSSYKVLLNFDMRPKKRAQFVHMASVAMPYLISAARDGLASAQVQSVVRELLELVETNERRGAKGAYITNDALRRIAGSLGAP